MSSSTSSSSRLRALAADRTARTLLLSSALTLAAGAVLSPLRDDETDTVAARDRFWALKTHFQDAACDVVILGDSRAYRGIAPQAMCGVLRDRVIRNFGYSSGGLNPLMYEAACKWLNPASGQKIVVLAVSPWSLTPDAAANAQFLEETRRPFSQVVERVYVKPMTRFFAPIGRDRIEALLCGETRAPPERHEEYHDDGWMSVEAARADYQRELRVYREGFQKVKVLPSLCEELFAAVRRWTDQGVLVVGVRVPTLPEMLEVENAVSGFDEETFVPRFAAAGGVWLAFDPADYSTYDGSHLDAGSAVRFSRRLDEEIARSLDRRPQCVARRPGGGQTR